MYCDLSCDSGVSLSCDVMRFQALDQMVHSVLHGDKWHFPCSFEEIYVPFNCFGILFLHQCGCGLKHFLVEVAISSSFFLFIYFIPE